MSVKPQRSLAMFPVTLTFSWRLCESFCQVLVCGLIASDLYFIRTKRTSAEVIRAVTSFSRLLKVTEALFQHTVRCPVVWYCDVKTEVTIVERCVVPSTYNEVHWKAHPWQQCLLLFIYVIKYMSDLYARKTQDAFCVILEDVVQQKWTLALSCFFLFLFRSVNHHNTTDRGRSLFLKQEWNGC